MPPFLAVDVVKAFISAVLNCEGFTRTSPNVLFSSLMSGNKRYQKKKGIGHIKELVKKSEYIYLVYILQMTFNFTH